MSEILVVPAVRETPAIGITDDGKKLQGQLIIRAAAVTEVATIETRDSAIATASAIKSHLKEVESDRQEVLRPFHATVAAINTAARDHIKDLDKELKRINGMVGNFELERQRQEYMEKEQASKELGTAAETTAAAVEAAPGSAAALEAALDAEERLGVAASKVENVLATQGKNKPTGGALRKDWDIAVSDIKALYNAHPQCVKLEANLLAIKDLLKAGITPAGVVATPKVAYSARAKR